MSGSTPPPAQQPGFVGELLDLSHLVGREITLYSEQIPGKALKTRVVSISGRQLLVDGAGRINTVENLVPHQQVIIQFPYKGQVISVRAELHRTTGGRCYFQLEEKVVPLSQRRYLRIDLSATTRLAPFPMSTFSRRNLARLRWIETTTRNFSSGGLLIDVPGHLERDVYLLLNVNLKSPLLPALILAQVRHCHPSEDNRYQVGVEFIVKEIGSRTVPATTIRELPSLVFSYSAVDRERLNKIVQTWTPDTYNQLP